MGKAKGKKSAEAATSVKMHGSKKGQKRSKSQKSVEEMRTHLMLKDMPLAVMLKKVKKLGPVQHSNIAVTAKSSRD